MIAPRPTRGDGAAWRCAETAPKRPPTEPDLVRGALRAGDDPGDMLRFAVGYTPASWNCSPRRPERRSKSSCRTRLAQVRPSWCARRSTFCSSSRKARYDGAFGRRSGQPLPNIHGAIRASFSVAKATDRQCRNWIVGQSLKHRFDNAFQDGAVLLVGAFNPVASALSAAMSCLTFSITLTFFSARCR